MGNWNYTTGSPVERQVTTGKYVKQVVDLKARGKHSGITYDLRDAFKELEKKGVLVDVKNDGFTKKDAWNLYLELDKIHKERKLDRNYTKMKEHTQFEYSESDVKRLAEAAGYKVKTDVEERNICQTDHTGVAPKPSPEKIVKKS